MKPRTQTDTCTEQPAPAYMWLHTSVIFPSNSHTCPTPVLLDPSFSLLLSVP